MNRTQKIVILFIALILVIMMLFPPFHNNSYNTGYKFILSHTSNMVNVPLLCMQFFVTFIIGGTLFLIFNGSAKSQDEKNGKFIAVESNITKRDTAETKKIVAREVIIFFSAAILVGLIWVGLWLYSSYFQSRGDSILKEQYAIGFKIDSIIQLPLSGEDYKKGIDKLIKDKKNDSFNFIWDSLKEDSIKKILAQPLQTQREQMESALHEVRQKYLSQADINYSTLIALCFIAIILYPVRGLYFLIRWAIKTLRQG